jgi:heme/copper-type cytochrome/quinol oxidase subunit 1
MAITETPSIDSATSGAPSAGRASMPEHGGVAGVLGSGDHKTIGRLYVTFSLAFGAVGLVVLGWFYLEAAMDPASQTARAFQNFTLGSIAATFILIVPLLLGLATAVVPLQVGARTIAFPRAAAAGFWIWAASSAVLGISYLSGIGGGIAGTDPNGVSLTFLALAGVVLGLLIGTVCVVVTVVALRPPGMSLDRVPFFSWSMVVAGGLWLITFPMLLGNLALIFVDQKYGSPSLFGVDAKQWSQLAWFTTQPQAFALAIPAVGIIADVVTTFARGRAPHRDAFLIAITLLGLLSFGAYVQPTFNDIAYHQWLFVVQSVLLIVPILILMGGLANAVRSGKPRMAPPVVLALVSLLLLLLAAIVAVPFGLGRLGLQTTADGLMEHNGPISSASTGAPIYQWGLYAVVVGAALTAAIAGLFYWAPKLTGRLIPGAIGSLLALVALVGTLAAGAPLVVLGFANKASGLADSPKAFYDIALGGCIILAAVAVIGLVLFLANRAATLGGSSTEADPWGCGQTLEWATDSPPAVGNFGELAEVVSAEPLLDLTESGGDS